MPEERRQGDLLILEKLSDIQTNLALNTRETSRIADAQVKTNGKVAAHEVRMQTLEANQALISTNLAKSDNKKGEWLDWFIKGVIVIGLALFYYLLVNAGSFPDFLK